MCASPHFLITSCTKEELSNLLGLHPKYRSQQLFKAIYAGAMQWEDVSVLPKAIRSRYAQMYPLISSQFVKSYTEKLNTKLVLKLIDDQHVETVLLVDQNGRKTACVSCQVGCAMGCNFCKTGLLGLLRNLQAGEIVEQILHLQHLYGPIDNVVYMGMGEPLNNLDEVIKSIRLLNSADGLGMSLRRFTISTCGLVSGIYRLIEEKLPVRLAFSLVTADQVLREKLMQTAAANPLFEIKKALIKYQEYSKHRITLEAALLATQNDRPQDAQFLANFVEGLDYMFNLIPWNPVPEINHRRPTEKEIQYFIKHLHENGIHIVRRYQRGATVAAACGQLGDEVKKGLKR